MKALWIVVALHVSGSSCSCMSGIPVYIGSGAFVYQTEAGCEAEADKLRERMLQKGHEVEIKCEKLLLAD
jgi:hypothetical protein